MALYVRLKNSGGSNRRPTRPHSGPRNENIISALEEQLNVNRKTRSIIAETLNQQLGKDISHYPWIQNLEDNLSNAYTQMKKPRGLSAKPFSPFSPSTTGIILRDLTRICNAWDEYTSVDENWDLPTVDRSSSNIKKTRKKALEKFYAIKKNWTIRERGGTAEEEDGQEEQEEQQEENREEQEEGQECVQNAEDEEEAVAEEEETHDQDQREIPTEHAAVVDEDKEAVQEQDHRRTPIEPTEDVAEDDDGKFGWMMKLANRSGFTSGYYLLQVSM